MNRQQRALWRGFAQHHAAVQIADRQGEEAPRLAEFPDGLACAAKLGAVHIVDQQNAASREPVEKERQGRRRRGVEVGVNGDRDVHVRRL